MSDQLGQPMIFVPLFTEEGERFGGETLHVTRLRDGEASGQGVYVIDCVPLFAELHHGDLVLCDETRPDKLPLLISILERRDITTVHLLFTLKKFIKAEEHARIRAEVLGALHQAGFFCERVEGKLYVINAASERLDELDRLLADFPTATRWWRDGDTPT